MIIFSIFTYLKNIYNNRRGRGTFRKVKSWRGGAGCKIGAVILGGGVELLSFVYLEYFYAFFVKKSIKGVEGR